MGFTLDQYAKKEKIHIFSLCQGDSGYHNHTFLELVYITAGKGLHYLDGVRTQVSEGDYFIIDYSSEHKYEALPDAELELVNCLFQPEFINPALRNCRSFQELLGDYMIRFGNAALNQVPTRCIFRDEDGMVGEEIQKMMQEYQEKEKGYLEILRCSLVKLLIMTMRRISDRKEETEDEVIEAVLEYVGENAAGEICLQEIAKKLSFSPQYLSMRFKEVTGTTFMEYVQRYRVGCACRLLVETDKKITEVAESVGYGDVKFFNQIFKRYMESTPGSFRRKGRGAQEG